MKSCAAFEWADDRAFRWNLSYSKISEKKARDNGQTNAYVGDMSPIWQHNQTAKNLGSWQHFGDKLLRLTNIFLIKCCMRATFLLLYL